MIFTIGILTQTLRFPQVIGRVVLGLEVLSALNDVPTNQNDVPVEPIAILDCGPTNFSGTHDSFAANTTGSSSRQPQSAEEAIQQLREDTSQTRDELRWVRGGRMWRGHNTQAVFLSNFYLLHGACVLLAIHTDPNRQKARNYKKMEFECCIVLEQAMVHWWDAFYRQNCVHLCMHAHLLQIWYSPTHISFWTRTIPSVLLVMNRNPWLLVCPTLPTPSTTIRKPSYLGQMSALCTCCATHKRKKKMSVAIAKHETFTELVTTRICVHTVSLGIGYRSERTVAGNASQTTTQCNMSQTLQVPTNLPRLTAYQCACHPHMLQQELCTVRL